MAEEEWHGIPRKEIPWAPKIDYKKCVGCGKCVEYCTLGTFTLEQKEDEKRAVVKNPNNCVVLCTGCDDVCPAGAVKHPSKKQTREKIKELRVKYSLSKQEKE